MTEAEKFRIENEIWLYFHKQLTANLYKTVSEVIETSKLSNNLVEITYALDCLNHYLPNITTRSEHIIRKSNEFLNSTSAKVGNSDI